ncbi:MAG: hypothetical protein NWE76_08400 [Candidatus Bathyarchaeota archaeon]|nr:hypothetical protein [Candidatus Bathyarchaeota archaeon]
MCQNVLVLGLGQVGGSIFGLLRDGGRFSVFGYDIDQDKMRRMGIAGLPDRVDVMHICYPCVGQDEFVKITADYVNRFEPGLTIIESTVPPGTTRKVYEATTRCIAHSPIRGIHVDIDSMKQEIMSWTKYVAGVDPESARQSREHFEKMGLRVKVLNSPFETELAKLFSTTYRALMIAWFQEMHRISRSFKANFDQIVDFLEDTHKVRLDRPIFFPSVIGGHCIIPNANLLMGAHKSQFVELIIESNRQREEEIGDEDTSAEVQRIRKRVEKLNEDLRIRKAAFNPSA